MVTREAIHGSVGESAPQSGWTPPPARNHSRRDALGCADPSLSSDLSHEDQAAVRVITRQPGASPLTTDPPDSSPPSVRFCIPCRYGIVVRTSGPGSSSPSGCHTRTPADASQSSAAACALPLVSQSPPRAPPAPRPSEPPTRARDTVTAARTADRGRCAPPETRVVSGFCRT